MRYKARNGLSRAHDFALRQHLHADHFSRHRGARLQAAQAFAHAGQLFQHLVYLNLHLPRLPLGLLDALRADLQDLALDLGDAASRPGDACLDVTRLAVELRRGPLQTQ